MDVSILQSTLKDIIIAARLDDNELAGAAVGSVDLTGKIRCDSRKVQTGDIFIAVAGPLADGHDYIDIAIDKGAALIISQRQLPDCPAGHLVVSDSALALGYLAQQSCGNPAQKLKCLGITGTNGKTTVTYLVKHILDAHKCSCGMLGTVAYDLGNGHLIKADNTTPGAVCLAEMMAAMVDNGCQAVVMECSSHGLDQRRTAGIDFDVAAFTNLTGDHLDYHGSRENYLAAKARLFSELGPDAAAIINIDDIAGAQLAELTAAEVCTYAIDRPADLTAAIIQMDLTGCQLELTYQDQVYPCCLPLLGRHNVENALAAIGLALNAGFGMESIILALNSFSGVPGRLEKITDAQDFQVLVDYAHTDDALDHALATLRGLNPSCLTVVFGCGGDRDQSKRPRMAQAALKWADKIIVTSDNPRGEDPLFIISQIRAGFDDIAKVTEIPDRLAAIDSAIRNAITGEVILIAGKGHEDYQLVGAKVLNFDDRAVARTIIKEMKS
ncbi:MAG: UDP-N-acetylmuramoyl-L-alanyl-D-glutamate--2,6-diaminopimelate ligase [Phycisphaerae bacterium]|nr:UDP-N-acetylmuramoyl-L-alanyl-D-glutamate--2,6-diaminopimelate ligase [Phycisphaerae bacterium]